MTSSNRSGRCARRRARWSRATRSRGGSPSIRPYCGRCRPPAPCSQCRFIAALSAMSVPRRRRRWPISRPSCPPPDPQTDFHTDTFHPTVKAWLFLTDVAAEAMPFLYVPGSHRVTPQRLAWERQMSITASRRRHLPEDRLVRAIAPATLAELGLPPPQAIAVPANTLVVADTFGFHARGPSAAPTMRVEIWASGRRNPFLPWSGLDPWSIGTLALHKPLLYWKSLGLLAA